MVALFYILEQLLNTPFKFKNRPIHFFNNILFQIVNYVVSFFFALFQVLFIQWLADHKIGILNQTEIPFVVKAFVGVACFDFTTYWFHRLAHKITFLWRMHRVHHSDITMDSSTFFRFHPLEIIFFGCGQILAATIFGLDTLILGLYFFIVIIFNVLQHANILFATWTDSLFGAIFATPNLHKVHHSQHQEYTDSNFSDIFILWDKFFGTYRYLPVKKIEYGLQEFNEGKKQTFWYLLKSPFLKIKRVTHDETDKKIVRNEAMDEKSIE
ncbi:MAG: sterol desaturase family protein [Chitinophagaceae bacterium]